MDYLSGKQNSQIGNSKDEKKERVSEGNSIFNKLCDTIYSYLNPDERASLSEKFLTSDIIEVMKEKEIVECINAFFKNNLNISETSRNAFLHRNTLLYRIEKIYKSTGLNIRNFDDAMVFRILYVVYTKMTEKNENDDEPNTQNN